MTRLSLGLALFLLASLAGNAVLLRRARHDAPPPTRVRERAAPPSRTPLTTMPRIPRPATPAPDESDQAAALQARMRELETEVAALKKTVAAYGEIPWDDVILASKRPLAWKLARIAELPPKERSHVAWNLGRRLRVRNDPAAVLRALHEETSVGALEVLAEVIRGGGLTRPNRATLEELGAVLATGQPAERRLAAAFGVSKAPQGDAQLEDVRAALLAATFRDETDPRVLAALSSTIYNNYDPPFRAELEQAVERMAPGRHRRRLLTAWASTQRSTSDAPLHGLYQRWTQATDPARREDAAAALGDYGNSFGGMTRRGEALVLARQRFVEVYGGTRERKTRLRLIRAAYVGLGLLTAEGRTGFLERLTSVEPDPDLRVRLQRLQDVLRKGALRGTGHLHKILHGE